MEITVRRELSNNETTVGRLFIDGVFECCTLEDEYRAVKKYGETRIPAGKYNIQFRRDGRFHEKYSERFTEFHIGMLQVVDVPGFEYILIHIGNTDDDTAGCLLVGKQVSNWKLVNSTSAYIDLYKQVAAALLSGEPVTIEYFDDDRKV